MYGHWKTDSVGEFNPEDYFGFIYLIVNNITNQKYIGKKQFMFKNRKKVKNRKNRKIVFSDSDWLEYTSSSKEVNLDIIQYGKDNFDFLIIKLCETKRELGYYEVEEQFKRNVLYSKLNNGLFEYYNKNIMSRWFVCESHTEETKEKIRKSNRKRKHSEETKKKMSKTRIEKKLSSGKNNPMYGKYGELHPLYGKPHTEETKGKIGEAHRGKILSEETKKKMSIRRKNFWSNEEKSNETKEKLINRNKFGDRTPSKTLKPVSDGKEVYRSLAECSKITGLTRQKIKDLIDNENNNWQYL